MFGLNFEKIQLSKNLLPSIFYKGINVIFSLLIVRFSIEYIGSESYGVWLTMFSFFTWFSAVEAGVSRSLRKKLTIYFSEKKTSSVALLIGKGYKNLAILFLIIISILVLISFFTPFAELFTGSLKMGFSNFKFLFVICTVLYISHFIFFFLNTILLSFHRPEDTYRLTAFQNAIIIAGILFLKYASFESNFFYFCVWLSLAPLLTWVLAGAYYFNGPLNTFKPKKKVLFPTQFKPLKKINTSFFIIQVCTLIIYSTDHLIITNYLSGTEVTKYNIGFKYFNLLTIVFNIIILPYWSMFSEAAHKKNKSWIKLHIKKLIIVLMAITFFAVIMLLFSDYFYLLWIGKDLNISFTLSVFMALSTLITAWIKIFMFYLNSIEDLKPQRNLLLISAVINLPLSIFLLSIWGAAGVIMATFISLLPLAFMLPIRYRYVLAKL